MVFKGVKERASEIGERPFSATFGTLFYIFGKLLLFGFFGLFVLFFITLLIAIFSNGNSPYPIMNSAYATASDSLVNIGLGGFVQQIKFYFGAAVTPEGEAKLIEEQSTWKSYVDKNTNKDLGVEITRFKALRSVIPLDYTGDIESVAEGSILSLEETTVKFSCLADGKEVHQNYFEKTSEIHVYPDIKDFFTFECVYSKSDFDIDTSESTDFKKIQLRTSYDFLTESNLLLYTLGKEKEYDLQREGVDVVEYIKETFHDDSLTKDGISPSVFTNGPVKLALSVYYTQPLSVGAGYTLGIKVDDNGKWSGGLENIDEIDLLLSPGLVLNDDEFEEVRVEDGLTLYRAKDKIIEDLYDICAPEEDEENNFGVINVDCWRAGNLQFNTEFSVKEDSEKPIEELIKAKIRYKFGDIKQDTIMFLNT